MDQPGRHQKIIQQAVILQDADPCIHANQKRRPERQHHRHHQQIAARRIRSRNVVRHRITNQQTQQRGNRRDHHRIHIGREIQAVGQQKRIVRQVQRDVNHTIGVRGEFRIGRNAKLQIGKADLHDQQERHEEEQQQPDERPGHHRGAAGQVETAHRPRRQRTHRALHDVSTTPADALQRTYTSSPQVGGSISVKARLVTLAITVLPASSFT